MDVATVIRLFSDYAELAVPQGEGSEVVVARLRGRLARHERGSERSALAVGDRVRVARPDGEVLIEERLERRTKISRRHPRESHREQVIAANVDQVLVLASAERPAFKPGLIDRYLVAASLEGLQAAICLSKCDLVSSERQDELLSVLSGVPGLSLFRLGRDDSAGLERLRQGFLVGRTTVFVGPSGVGKSTLRNALLGASATEARTGAVSAKWGKGRHVTSAATLDPLPGGGFLVDTPGVREFGLWRLDPRTCAEHFPEFAGRPCRFADCRHDKEPDCALRELVAKGEASATRLASLRALAEG